MKLTQELTQKYDSLNDREKTTFNQFIDIGYSFDGLFRYHSNLLASENCYMNYTGLRDYEKYQKGSLKFIHEKALQLALETYSNPNRKKNRNIATIVLNELTGILAELTAAMEYGLSWEEFLKQTEDRTSYTSYDLLIKGKKVEVKTIHQRYLYNGDNHIPIDTSNKEYSHPKHWKKDEDKFDFTALFYVWKGRFRLFGEVGWHAYETESFLFGSTKGPHREYYERRMLEDPSSKYKIVISTDYIDSPGKYLTLQEA